MHLPPDQLGAARYNDPRTTTKTGVANGSGVYPDMGAFEFVETAPSRIDLAAVNVAGPAAAVAGQTATITWSDENLGSGSALGGWHDEIDLVLSPGPNQTVLNAGDVLVAENTTLGPNQTLNLSANVTVPGGLPGNYFWQVVPDATGDVFQGVNQGVGKGLATVTTALSLPTLAVNGAATADTFTTPGQIFFYQVTPTSNADMLLTLNSPAATGDVELYAAAGFVPTPETFQVKSQQFNSPTPTLVFPAPTVGVPFYVIAYGRTLTTATVAFTLAAATPSFSLGSVTPNSAGNSGAVTLQITGGQLTAGDSYQLTGPGGTFTATQVQVQDSSTVNATFNLNGAAAGAYSVVVTPAGGSAATLNHAVQIQTAVQPALATQVLVPSVFRVGRVFDGTIVYTNIGNVDMPAPILTLSTGGQAELSLDGTNFSTNDLQLIGVAFSGPAGVLRPGQTWSIPFQVLCNSATNLSFQLTYDLSSDTTPVDYATLGPEVMPPGISAAYWNAAWGEFQSQAGPTWGGIVRVLAQYAGYIVSIGNTGFDSESTVFDYALQGELQQAEASATGHLYLNDTKHPLAGAEVTLTNGTNSSGGVSNPDGSFVVDALPAGTYNATVDGYLLPNPVEVTVPATGAATGLSIIVTAGGTISGAVHSATNGSASAGTAVLALNTTDQTKYQTTTGADGSYALTGLTDGSYDLTIGGAPSETQYLDNVQIADASTVSGLNFTLAAGATVTGQVVAGGSGVAGAFVTLTDANGDVVDATADASGNYSFSGLSAGSYTEQAFAQSFGETQTTVAVTAGAVAGCTQPGVAPFDTLTVTVNDANGNPLADGAVALQQNGNAIETLGANAQGVVSFTSLSDGTYQLAISAAGYLTTSDSVTLQGGDTVMHTYELQSGFTLQGKVTGEAGAPIAGILVELTAPGSGGSTIEGFAATASDGTYQFTGLPAATYTVRVGNGTGIDPQTATLGVASPQATIPFSLTGAAITGTVVAADGSTPVSNAQVVLISNGQTILDGQTDSNGTYAFYGLAAGTYSVQAAASGNGLTPLQSVTVAANQAVTAPMAVFSNINLHTTITDQNGKPIAGAAVSLEPSTDLAGGPIPIATSDADGTVAVDGLPEGTYTLVVTSADEAPLVESVTISASNVIVNGSDPTVNLNAVPLSPGVGVTGSITDPSTGNGLAQATVTFVDPTTHMTLGSATTDGDGQYTVTNLPTGAYNVEASLSGHQTQVQSVQVSTNPDRVNVDLPSNPGTITGVVKDDTGEGLPGATVAVYDSSGRNVINLFTENDGSYSYSQLAPGTYTVQISAHGYKPTQAGSINVTSGGTATVSPTTLASAGASEPGNGPTGPGTVGTVPPGGGPISIADPPEFPVPSSAVPPKLDSDDPSINAAPPIGTCTQAQTAFKRLFLERQQVILVYDAWVEAYDNRETSSWVVPATVVADVANVVATLIGELIPLKSVIEEGIETLTTGAAAQQIVFSGTAISLANLANAVVSTVNFISGFSAKGFVTDPSESLAGLSSGIISIWSGVLGSISSANSIGALAELFAGFGGELKLFSAAPGLATIGAVLGGIGDFLNAFAGYQNSLAGVPQAASNYEAEMNRYRAQLASYLQIESQCPPPANKGPGGSSGTQQGGTNQSGGHQAGDPNDLTTTGYGPQGYIAPTATITYTIDFENEPTATAPAQVVFVTDPLPTSINYASVQLTSIAFNGVVINIAPGLSNYSGTATVSTDPTHPVDVEATFDPASGLLTLTLTSTDPVTGQLTADPLAGFLPPDNALGQGEGYITFTAQPAAGSTTINNLATVIFDVNALINTPTVVNTIDATPPTSSVSALPAFSPTTSTISWTAQDGSGSGVAGVNVYVSDNGGPFNLLISATTQTSTSFTGQDGHTYDFYSIAVDNIGLVQPTPAMPQASTTIIEPPSFISASAAMFTAGQANTFPITAASAPAATYSLGGGNLPANVSFTDNGNGAATLAGTPNLGAGVYVFDITANNNYTPAATQVFTLTVVDPPAFTTNPASATFTVGMAGHPVTVTTAPGLPTKTILSISPKLPGGLTFLDHGNGTATISGTPSAGTGGQSSYTITASNGPGSAVTQSFTLTIDQKTAFTSAASYAFVAGQPGSYAVTTTGFPTASLSATNGLPTWAHFTDNGNGTGLLTGTPPVGSASASPITITLTATGLTVVTQPFKLTVTQLPVITSEANATFTVGTAGLNFTVRTTAGVPTKTTLSISPEVAHRLELH